MQERPITESPLPGHQRGASLIEVLVAALLLSIGLLSMIGIQGSAMRLSKEAQSRSIAADLANSFGEMVRANVAGAQAGNYVYTTAYAPPAGQIAQPGNQCDNPAAVCTAAQIAAVDLARWRESARLALPGGNLIATVTTPASATQSPVVDLWVLWLTPEADDANDAATQQLGTNCPAQMGNPTPRPQCMLFRIQL